MRLIVAATIGLFAAGTLHAAPLCRDSKGLFTPCPSGTDGRRHEHGIMTVAGPERTETTRPEKPAKLSLVRKAKLCRDSKGLFKPC